MPTGNSKLFETLQKMPGEPMAALVVYAPEGDKQPCVFVMSEQGIPADELAVCIAKLRRTLNSVTERMGDSLPGIPKSVFLAAVKAGEEELGEGAVASAIAVRPVRKEGI